jgi:Ca2+-binding RTX toxin-like protein
MSKVPRETFARGRAERNTSRPRHRGRRFRLPDRRRLVATASALIIPTALVVQVAGVPATNAAVAPVGQGFNVTAGDLSFILKQIKIAEHHAATLTPADPCGTLVGPGPNQIPDRLSAYGLRTVDGSCNNLFPGRENFAAADQPFPRIATPDFRDAEPITPALPVGPLGPTSYKQKKGNVVDSQPRVVSNLVVDQTSTNPAAVAAAEFPVRTQGNPGKFPCTTDPDPLAVPPVVGVPADCVPTHQTLFIPNVTTDVGLSPPYNSMFTFFGQFFDHGVDQTVKSGGTVFVPLRDDDPLIAGPDHIRGNADDLAPNLRFMVLTRAQNQPGPDGVLGDDPATLNVDESADDVQNANNTDSPWVDQSQTYTSHSSHQVFLREYVDNPAGKPVSTGKLLGGLPAGGTYLNSPDGRTGIGTWAAVKKQAATELGLLLTDADVTNIPMVAADPYGKFLPGPNGLPQYVTKTGLVEGNRANPVRVPGNVLHFDTPFLTDIAHNADPSPQDTDNNPATPPVTPVPDQDHTPSADFAHQPPGTYDDEMLDAHFACGDGRCNENIALSTIHQVFHSEHDRLIDDIKKTLTSDTSAAGVAALPDWKLAAGADGWNGERLFQAARFVTEMEYQHLVFEEFGRKVQPAIRPFHVYHPDINPAIQAEFAHAVYRFGHSMLDDTVARTNTDPLTGAKSDNSLPLLDAFLNPPEFFDGGTAAGTLTPEAAAGSIVMGSSDQTGNELDEFVTETLRNNLLGLPLDLPTINMTRAREAGVPRLNAFRRQVFNATNDGQMAPYTDWSDFGQHLKHPESLINFVAAYGTHPSITSQTTLAGKREAARVIVDPTSPVAPGVTPAPVPDDAADFMFGTGAYKNDPNGVTNTGVDDVDLWVGGLAEITNLFGGLLGSTFNYVFQTQLENLQDGDRLYYLNRTPGMNLRTQLEGNSFSEMIQRNTDNTNTLKADVFATADCKFQLKNITSPASPAGADGILLDDPATPIDEAADNSFITGAGSVNDDTTTDCNENRLLLEKTDGTVQYRQFNSVDPSGINGQAVYNGTPGVDKVFGGNDNDTFWGGDANDVIEGNGGDDVALGGDGNDRITDLSGADVLKGGRGNDATDGGIGDDIFMGGDGKDFINGGANDNEAFAGPGDDYVIAGQGADAVFGDGGDDWIEGGSGQDLLQGDHGAPFFDDPAETLPGNEVMVGQVGENDYDAEGGDDIMSQNAAIDRNAGAGGFDWAIHQYDTVGADDDMAINNNLGPLPIQVVVNRDRWQETEANSGSAFNDVIRGNDDVPSALGGAGFTGCDVLDQAGVDRISGLGALLPRLTGDLAPVVAASAAGTCPLSGPIWGDGNILLGGGGSDTITGRGADDIIDGDRALTVAITVHARNADGTLGAEIGRTDLMENKAQGTGTFGPGTAGMTLQQAVFAGLVDPGDLVTVREINPVLDDPAKPASVDTAVFSGPSANYTITPIAGGVTVRDNVGTDGTDTVRNVEKLQFADGVITVDIIAPTVTAQAPAAGATSVAVGVSPTVTFSEPVTGVSNTTLTVRAAGAAAPVAATVTQVGTSNTWTVVPRRNLASDTRYTVTVTGGPAAIRDLTGNPLTTVTSTFLTGPAPTITTRTPVVNAVNVAPASNVDVTFSEAVNGVTLRSTVAAPGTFSLRTSTGAVLPAGISQRNTRTWRLNPDANLAPATKYTVVLTGGTDAIRDLAGNPLPSTTWTFTTR